MRIEFKEFLHHPLVDVHTPAQRRISVIDYPLDFEPPYTHLTEFIGDPKSLPRNVTCIGVVGGLAPQVVLDVRGKYKCIESLKKNIAKSLN